MTKTPNGINGTILRWARESAGLPLDFVAHAMKQPIGTIQAWESDKSFPTYTQLEKLAYTHYKRPIAIFFFPEPPDEADPRTEFRLLPASDLDQLDSDTILATRQALSFQESLREFTDNRNPSSKPILSSINARRFTSLHSFCSKVRAHLGVSLEQQCSWPSLKEAFKSWRKALEDSGIFLFKRSFKNRNISGFCLYDDEFPIIYINNSASPARQIFTIFHELAHILFAISSVTVLEPLDLDLLASDERKIEQWCNKFAAEFLVPDDSLDTLLDDITGSDEDISQLATYFNVSREVILRKLLDRNIVTTSRYERAARRWNHEWEGRDKGTGGNYYYTQATYLGTGFLKLAFSNYYNGRCTLQDLSAHLNVKAKNVHNLEDLIPSKS